MRTGCLLGSWRWPYGESAAGFCQARWNAYRAASTSCRWSAWSTPRAYAVAGAIRGVRAACAAAAAASAASRCRSSASPAASSRGRRRGCRRGRRRTRAAPRGRSGAGAAAGGPGARGRPGVRREVRGQSVDQRLGVVRAARGEQGQGGDGVGEPLARGVRQRAQVGAVGRRGQRYLAGEHGHLVGEGVEPGRPERLQRGGVRPRPGQRELPVQQRPGLGRPDREVAPAGEGRGCGRPRDARSLRDAGRRRDGRPGPGRWRSRCRCGGPRRAGCRSRGGGGAGCRRGGTGHVGRVPSAGVGVPEAWGAGRAADVPRWRATSGGCRRRAWVWERRPGPRGPRGWPWTWVFGVWAGGGEPDAGRGVRGA